MKAKLTITVDETLVPDAKRYARQRGVSLSHLIEQALRELSASETPTFATRWLGRFRPARRRGRRYRRLAKKYL